MSDGPRIEGNMGADEQVDIAVLKSDVSALKSWAHDLNGTLRDLSESVTELRVSVASIHQPGSNGHSAAAVSAPSAPEPVPFWKTEAFWTRIILYVLLGKAGFESLGHMITGG